MKCVKSATSGMVLLDDRTGNGPTTFGFSLIGSSMYLATIRLSTIFVQRHKVNMHYNRDKRKTR